MLFATVLAVLAAATAPSDDDRLAIEEKFVEIFRAYEAEASDAASWDYPIYSAEVTALIAGWRSVMPEGELDGLNDGDWKLDKIVAQSFPDGLKQALRETIAADEAATN